MATASPHPSWPTCGSQRQPRARGFAARKCGLDECGARGDWAQSWQIPTDGTSAGITPHVLQYAHSSDVFPRSGCAGVQSACRLHPPGVDGSRLRHGPPTTSERHTSEVMRRGCWISSSTYRFGSGEQSPTGGVTRRRHVCDLSQKWSRERGTPVRGTSVSLLSGASGTMPLDV